MKLFKQIDNVVCLEMVNGYHDINTALKPITILTIMISCACCCLYFYYHCIKMQCHNNFTKSLLTLMTGWLYMDYKAATIN